MLRGVGRFFPHHLLAVKQPNKLVWVSQGWNSYFAHFGHQERQIALWWISRIQRSILFITLHTRYCNNFQFIITPTDVYWKLCIVFLTLFAFYRRDIWTTPQTYSFFCFKHKAQFTEAITTHIAVLRSSRKTGVTPSQKVGPFLCLVAQNPMDSNDNCRLSKATKGILCM